MIKPIDESLTHRFYRDAALYDHTYARRKHDVRFYVDYACSLRAPSQTKRGNSQPSILELGVGTGRVAMALARAGLPTTGVDASAEMIERAKERLSRLPHRFRHHVKLSQADLRTLRLRRRFDLVLAPFNVFMHLYTRRDVERALATVRQHMKPRAAFVFDVLVPDPDLLARNPARTYRCGHIHHPLSGVRYRYDESFRYDPVHQLQTIHMKYTPPRGPTLQNVLLHRQFFPAELEALLHYNGFAIENHYGDFERTPLAVQHESQIIVAHARRTRSSAR